MVGHSFGLVFAVYNYNRRSAAITDIVAAFNLYDDKYGFEPEDTSEGAFALVAWCEVRSTEAPALFGPDDLGCDA